MGKILVVVDMQNDFITGALGTAEAMAIVPGVIEKIKSFEGDVLFTRDTHDRNYLKTKEGSLLPVPHCIIGTEGWQLEKEIRAFKEEHTCPTFDKHSFGSKLLADFILKLNKEEKLESIEFVGLCTDICVISNVLTVKTYLPDTEIIVHKGLTAGTTPENRQKALDIMEICQITLV